MSNINVALSTSKYCLSIGSDEYQKLDIPICVASQGILMYGGNNSENEAIEHQLCETTLSMAKMVSIDTEKRTVFIGVDPADLETALVDYEEPNASETALSFFKRWKELDGIMLFEFQVIGNTGNFRYAIRGLWVRDHWDFIKALPSGQTHIVS